MTEHDDDEEEMRQFVRDLFRRDDTVPTDVVQSTGPTADDYRRWNDATDTYTEVTRYGEPMLDTDGNINAMPAPVVENVLFGGVAVTATELARVGLTHDDVPRLHLIGPPGGPTVDHP